MKFRIVLALLCGLFCVPAYGGSSIDTTKPAQGAPFASAPVRQNFTNAASDINNLQSRSAGVSQPSGLATFQDWANTTGCPSNCQLNVFDGTVPVPYGQLNETTHIFSHFSGVSGPQTAQIGTLFRAAQINGAASRYETDSYAAQGFFTCVRADGTLVSPTALQANDQLCGFNAHGYDGSSYLSTPAAAFRIYAAQNWGVGANGTYLRLATTPNGSTALTDAFSIENDGGVTVPPAVLGGSKGFGTVNATSIYVAGSPLGNVAMANAGIGLAVSLGNLNLQPSSASTLGGVQSLTCSTSNWFRTLSTGGVFGCSQPSASDISFVQQGTGAATVTVGSILYNQLLASQFTGYDATGATDSTTAVQNCLNAVGATGGKCIIPQGSQTYLASSITIPPNAALDCGLPYPNDGGGNLASTTLGSLSSIQLASTATINMGGAAGSSTMPSGNAGIVNCFLRLRGLTLPANGPSGYAGTALTWPVNASGNYIRNVMAVGFQKCLVDNPSSATNNYAIDQFWCDANPGTGVAAVGLVNSFGQATIGTLILWPLGTVSYNSGAPPAINNIRTGYGLSIGGRCDGLVLQNATIYGYSQRGLDDECASSEPRYGKLWIDGGGVSGAADAVYIGQAGNWHNFDDLTIVGGNTRGLVVAGNAFVNISTLTVSGTSGDCVAHQAGNLYIGTAYLSVCGAYPLDISTTGYFSLNEGRLTSSNGGTSNPYIAIASGFTPDRLKIGAGVTTDQSTGASLTGANNLLFCTVASASITAPPVNCDTLEITGTTTINNITGTYGGRKLVLKFDGALTVQTGGNVNLSGGAPFVAAAGSTLALVYDAANTTWQEISRSGTNGPIGGSWTAYTPTVTCGTGSLTTGGATGRYKQLGKTLFVEIVISDTTNGTCAGYFLATLPLSLTAAAQYALAGYMTLPSLSAVSGLISASQSSVTITTVTGTYPGSTGASLFVSGLIETQ